jgi:hypothetical protein
VFWYRDGDGQREDSDKRGFCFKSRLSRNLFGAAWGKYSSCDDWGWVVGTFGPKVREIEYESKNHRRRTKLIADAGFRSVNEDSLKFMHFHPTWMYIYGSHHHLLEEWQRHAGTWIKDRKFKPLRPYETDPDSLGVCAGA